MKLSSPITPRSMFNTAAPLPGGRGPEFGRIIFQARGLNQRRLIHGQRFDVGVVNRACPYAPAPLTCSV